jgi:FlaG/FlaF family flagellin (archaellin)
MNARRKIDLRKRRDDAVSPVVGVMLMLVVTIIIAAVVSGFAGGLAGSSQKAPDLMMDVKIANSGVAVQGSYILFDVQSVSEPILTKDLRITTSWVTTNKDDGSRITGGATVVAGATPNTDLRNGTSADHQFNSPLGFGTGVTVIDQGRQKTSTKYDFGQYFGNYTLMSGTSMKNSAGFSSTASYTPEYGYGLNNCDIDPFAYHYGETYPAGSIDGMQAILGEEWYHLRSGDSVNVMVMHIPSGKVIFQKNVGVQ